MGEPNADRIASERVKYDQDGQVDLEADSRAAKG